MGLFIATIVGYTVVLLVGIALLIRYLQMGLDSSSSVKIDPLPTKEQ